MILLKIDLDSVFIKGHDGDHLIFMYGSGYDRTLLPGY